MKKIFKHIITYIILLFVTNPSFATIYTWTGNTSTAWNLKTNWSSSGLFPSSTNDTVIIVSATNNPVLDTNRAIGKFTMTSGTLDLNTWTLNITGKAEFNGGTIQGTATDALQPRGGVAAFAGTTFDAEINAVCGYIALSGSTFNKVAWLEMTSSSNGLGNGGNTFTKKVTMKVSGSGSFRIAEVSANTFSDTAVFINAGTGELRTCDKGHTAFNGNVYVNSTYIGSVNFGSSAGDTATLASGKIMAVGSSGFSSGTLLLQRFVQSGSTANTVTLTGSAIFNTINSIFNGKLTITSPSVLLRETKFYDTLAVTQIANRNTASYGGNLFDKTATIKNHGSANFQLATNAGDTFNADADFVTDSTGNLYVCYSDTNYFKGNLTATGSLISFRAGTGVVRFSGNISQTVNGTNEVNFGHVSMKKTSGTVTLNKNIAIAGNLQLLNGIIISDTTNIVSMGSGSSVSGASDSSFVRGPVKKYGDGFVFPTGKGNFYRAIETSGVLTAANAFTAEYFDGGQSLGNTMDGTMKYIRDCGYWNVARNSGTSNPTVKLYWDSTACGLLDSATAKVANWNGSTWKDLGNGGITGNKYVGKVANSTTVITWGYFALAYNKCFITAAAGIDQSICANDSTTIGAPQVVAMGTSPYTYSWNPSGSLNSSTVANPKAEPNGNVNYIVTVTDNSGCTKSDTIAVSLDPIEYSLSANDMIWTNIFPKGRESHGNSIQQTIDSGYVVCGSFLNSSNTDLYLLKLNSDGDTLWTRTIGGSGDETGTSVKQCRDSGFIMTGYTGSYGAGSDDFYIVKTDKNGSVQWTQTSGTGAEEKSNSIIQTLDGGFLSVGYEDTAVSAGKNMIAVKFNSSGIELWSQSYGGADDDIAYSVAQLRDSGFVICGSTKSFSADEDVYIVRADKNGDTLWTKYYEEDGEQTAFSIYACEELGFIIGGKTETEENGDDMLLMKIYDDGTLIFEKTFGGAGDEAAYDVKETKNYSYILAGKSTSFSDGTDGYLIETDYTGDLVNESNVISEYDDDLSSVCVTIDNNFATTGSVKGCSSSSPVAVVLVHLHCVITFPRGLWAMNCWRYDSHKGTNMNFPNTRSYILIDDIIAGCNKLASDKINEFVDYCVKAKVHSVVLGHLEDVFRVIDIETNVVTPTYSNFNACICSINGGPIIGTDLRDNLKSLLSALHLNGIVVYALWLDDRTGNPALHEGVYENDCVPDLGNGHQFNDSYNYDDEVNSGSITHTLEELNAFLLFNDTQTNTNVAERFDGIMLDYEYFTADYGGSDAAFGFPNGFALTGFKDKWLHLANDNTDGYLTIRQNNATNHSGVNLVQCYLNAAVFTSENQINNGANGVFDYEPLPSGNGVTNTLDSKQELWDIDGLGFDAISVAFTPKDNYFNIASQNNDPTSFLSGKAIESGPAIDNESSFQRSRYLLELLGNEGNQIKTPIIPYLRSLNDDLSVSGNGCYDDACVGNILLIQCTWDPNDGNISWPTTFNPSPPSPSTLTHFLPDMEREFIEQFDTRYNIITGSGTAWSGGIYGSIQDDPYATYGNCDLLKGFYWFQYGMGAGSTNCNIDNTLEATSDYAIQSRSGDQVNLVKDYCAAGTRYTNNHQNGNNNSAINPINDKEGIDNGSYVYPNPFSTEAKLICTESSDYRFEITNIVGQNTSDKFKIVQLERNYKIISMGALNGIYFITIYDSKGMRKNISFTVFNHG